jgi:hypothetical protein
MKFLSRQGLSLQKSKWHSAHTPGYVRIRKFWTVWFQTKQENWVVIQPCRIEHLHKVMAGNGLEYSDIVCSYQTHILLFTVIIGHHLKFQDALIDTKLLPSARNVCFILIFLRDDDKRFEVHSNCPFQTTRRNMAKRSSHLVRFTSIKHRVHSQYKTSPRCWSIAWNCGPNHACN